jgi:hypothetical protein
LGRGTASLRGAVLQLAAKRRSAGERREREEFMEEVWMG